MKGMRNEDSKHKIHLENEDRSPRRYQQKQ